VNKKQKLLTIGAIGVFILTLIFTPWAKPDARGNEWGKTGETNSPVWDGAQMEREARMRLHNDFVMMEWAGIGLIYAVLLFVHRKP
jgi:hypothetical protein